MFRLITALAALLFAAPALADDIKVVGASPGPHYTVYQGDRLILKKPMGREWAEGKPRAKDFACWIDRQDGKCWYMDNAQLLKLVGLDPTLGGYVYVAPDAPTRAVVVVTPPPVITPPSNTPDRQMGVNLAGCYVTPALCPYPSEVQDYWNFGFGTFRFGFKSSTITHATLDPPVDMALQLGARVMLDRHDFA